MKIRNNRQIQSIATGLCAALILTGCAQQQQQQPRANYGGSGVATPAGTRTHTEPHAAPAAAPTPTPTPAPAPAPAVRTEGYGPSYSTYEADGAKWLRGSMAFPSGRSEGSGVLLEKIVPAEAIVGSPFTYRYEIKNLTPFTLHQVMVTDRVSSNFNASSSDPKPANVNGGLVSWSLDNLGPNETKIIAVTGTASEEGTVTTCGWATYSPILCAPIKILKPGVELVKRMTPEATICDPINLTLIVQNSGTSTLHDLTVVDELPAGLSSADGLTSLSFSIATLAAGESKEIPVVLKAGRTGKFDNVAKLTCKEGLTREATASTAIRQALLQLTCTAPAEHYLGRGGDFCFKVSNTGDAACNDAVIEASLPAGVKVQNTTGGGTVARGKLTWRIGALSAGESKEVCATLLPATAGQLSVSASASCGCATPATATCETSYRATGAVLIEVVDVSDPIEVGSNDTYEIVVTNQGTAPLTNVKLTSKLESAQEFVSGSGDSAVSGSGANVDYAFIASIAPKAKVSWKVLVKALKAGDVRFTTTLNSDQTEHPVEETESTHQF